MKPIARKAGAGIASASWLLALLALQLPAAASAARESPSEAAAAQTAALIGSARHTPAPEARPALACRLPRLVEKIDARDVTAPLIDGLAALLLDHDHWVLNCAATALAVLGPAANRALPALDAAMRWENYKDDSCITGTGIHPCTSMLYAVWRITDTVPE